MFYKLNSTTLIWGNSFYKESPASISGYAAVNWVINTGITTAFTTQVAENFIENHSELFPLPQAAMEANPMLIQDFGHF